MGLEQNNEQHYREVVDKYHDPSATYQMNTRDYVMRPTVDAAPIVLTLPQVAESKGRFYSIIARGNVDTTNTVTIQNNGESENWIGDIVLSELGDGAILYSDGLAWSGRAFSDHVGLLVSPDVRITTGVRISGLTTTAIHISGVWGDTANVAAILIAADAAGTALALGAHTTEMIMTRVNVTAAVTNNSNYMANYTTMATSGAMLDGFIIGHYIRVNINHVAFENYAIWGRMNVSVAQAGDSGNQYIGVFGAVNFSTGAHALLATGGGYGVLGTAGISAGGTIDQPLIGGYFEANAVDTQGGTLVTAIRARMLGYCNYGLDVLCQTNNNIAGIHLLAQDAARMSSGIKFEASASGGQGYIHHAFRFLDADQSDGASVATTTITNADSAEGVIKIDCNGTHYYIPFYDAGVIDTEWADQ